tara:strand:- start:679 stop:1293 length:615 start_codon:yes stop_codon:yes gene_type:complete
MKKFFSLFLSFMSFQLQLMEITPQNLFDIFNSRSFISADFNQSTIQDEKERKIQGSILASRAGKFKVIYLEPISEIISSDGRNLFRLDYELNQLDVFSVEDYFANVESPISFFTKSSRELREIYAVHHCEQTNEISICVITPKEDDTFLKKLFISLDINTIYSISYKDTFDQEVKISFTNLSWQNLSDEKFTFDMPPKIDIVYH